MTLELFKKIKNFNFKALKWFTPEFVFFKKSRARHHLNFDFRVKKYLKSMNLSDLLGNLHR